jgi:hypothetical protein
MMRFLRVIATFSAVIGLISASTPPVLAAASARAATSPLFQERFVLPNSAGPLSVQAQDSIEWLIPLSRSAETPGINRPELPIQLDALVTSLKNLAQRIPNERIQLRLRRLAALSAAGPVIRTGKKAERRQALDQLGVSIQKQEFTSTRAKTFSVNGRAILRLTTDNAPLARVRPLRNGSEQPDGASAFQEPQELVDAADAEAIQQQDDALAYVGSIADEAQQTIDDINNSMSLLTACAEEAPQSGPSASEPGLDCFDYAVGAIVDGAVTIAESVRSAANIRNAYQTFRAAVTAPALAYMAYAEFAAAIEAALAALISAISAEVVLPAILLGGVAYLAGKYFYCRFLMEPSGDQPLPAAPEFPEHFWQPLASR